MNSKNSKTNKPNRFKYDLIDKLDFKNPNKNMALANLSIYYTWKNVKSTYNNSKFKISAPTWNETFDLPDGLYNISEVQDYIEYIIKKHETIGENAPILIYATFYQYKRDEPPEDDAVADLTADNSSSFKYKIKLLGNVTRVAGNAAGVRRLNVKVVVPLKYLSNFFRSLEMPLINCKIKLNLTWKKECVLSTGDGDPVFIINDTKM